MSISFNLVRTIRDWGDNPSVTIRTGTQSELIGKLKRIKQEIVKYHLSVDQPYLYHADIVPVPPPSSQISKKTIALVVCSVALSFFIFLTTRPYFQKEWNKCLSIADGNAQGFYQQNFFQSYATPREVWLQIGPVKSYFIRNVVCIVIPPLTYFIASKFFDNAPVVISHRRNLDISRRIYERPIPTHALESIQNREEITDPFSLDPISRGKLSSPQYILLQHDFLETKAYLKMIFEKGDYPPTKSPIHNGDLGDDQEKVMKQITEIYHINRVEFFTCFSINELISQRDRVKAITKEPERDYHADLRNVKFQFLTTGTISKEYSYLTHVEIVAENSSLHSFS